MSVNFVMSFWHFQFSQKMNQKVDFTTMVPQVELFLIFERIEEIKKTYCETILKVLKS